MWQAPNRPNKHITQPYNDGVVKIYHVVDVAEPGYRPVEKLHLKASARYEEQRLGIQRYYSGQQNQVEIERVIRIPKAGTVSSQDVAITEDGHQYRIDMVQKVDGIWPPSLDLTLARIDQDYEVEDEVV